MRLDSPPHPEELLGSARAGKRECLGQLLQLYGNYLKLLAATQIDEKLLARSSPSDVVQETFLEAHRDFDRFRGESVPEFLAWLRTILVNNLSRLVERHLLAEKRDVRRETSLDGIGDALERSAARLESVLVDEAASPSSNAQRREYAIILANELAELREDHRDVIVLRHLEGLPFGEIAERMGRSPGAVRMLWLRAIGQLRARLDARGLT